MKFSFLTNITYKGIKEGMSPTEEKVVILTNYILLIASLVAFARIFLFFISEDWFYSFISLIAASFFLLAYYLNTKQYYDFAKFFLIIAGNAATMIKELMSGGTSNQLFLVIASYGIIFLLFSIKEKKKIFIALIIPTINLLICIFFPNILAEPHIADSQVQIIEKFAGAMSSVVIIVLVIWYFVKKSTDSETKLINSNKLLSDYNSEISSQKELIELQYIELEAINNDLLTQKQIIEEQHSALTSSITYASTIQNALLPSNSYIKEYINDFFILYKPKDIVSGDFYWFKELDGIIYIAVIDCTGHGIPGSMLTVIANSVLDDAVLGKKLTSTSEILTYMNEKVTEVLNQRLKENNLRDGMEVCLVAIHQDKILFSGAGRPLYIKNGTLEIIKTDKRGIAGQNDNDIFSYSSVIINRTENLVLYLSSDGFADQMNENTKKYSTKRFMETLDKISNLPFEKQKEFLENEFNSHKGNREQIDDVTIIGVRI